MDKDVKKIQSLDWGDLARLWQKIESAKTPGWAAGKALELLILRAFQLSNAEVIWPFNVKVEGNVLEQIDGVVYAEGLTVLCESKDYSTSVNFEPIAKLRQQISRRPPAVIGSCFSRNGFTTEAIMLTQRCSPQNVLLWHGEEIEFAIHQRNMTAALATKYRKMVEYAVPDFKINI